MSRVRAAPGEALDAVADATQRVGVLLAAGLDPRTALRALEAPLPPLAAAARCDDPQDVPAALLAAIPTRDVAPARAWGLLALSWTIAVEAGAPLAPTLDRAAETLRALAEAERQLELAIVGPLATARIVALLPAVGLGMGVLIGADPLGVLFGTIPGAVAGVLGAALLALGVRWNRRLVAAARRTDPLAGVGHELVSLAMAGGATPGRALALVESAAAVSGIEVSVAPARDTLDFAARAGAPAAALLRAEAHGVRRRSLAEVLTRAALLPTRLLGPLAACFLPAFVLLGVVPLVIGILRDTLAAF